MPEHYVARNPQTAWRVYDGEAVILLAENSTLNTLTGVLSSGRSRMGGRRSAPSSPASAKSSSSSRARLDAMRPRSSRSSVSAAS